MRLEGNPRAYVGPHKCPEPCNMHGLCRKMERSTCATAALVRTRRPQSSAAAFTSVTSPAPPPNSIQTLIHCGEKHFSHTRPSTPTPTGASSIGAT
eukprot:193506-Chlamydomonas_euryale.AAC.2